MLKTSARPDAALILYGAFSDTDIDRTHPYDEALMKKNASLDALCHITSNTPPMFLFQTNRDDPRIGLQFASCLARYGVPFEIHTFEEESMVEPYLMAEIGKHLIMSIHRNGRK